MLVYLLRESNLSSSPTDPYQDILSTHAYSPTTVPVLDHVLIDKTPPLADTLSTSNYRGLILTSQRAVDALRAANTPIHPNTPVFVVGPATATALKSFPPSIRPSLILGADTSGNATLLAEYIVSYFNERSNSNIHNNNDNNKSPLFFLAGQKHSSTLASRLQLASIPLQTIVVYRTDPRTDFTPHFKSLLDKHTTHQQHEHEHEQEQQQQNFWIACFSPTGAQLALPIILQRNLISHVKIAAIGPTTKAYIESNFPPISVHALAASPDPQSLLSAMQQSDQ